MWTTAHHEDTYGGIRSIGKGLLVEMILYLLVNLSGRMQDLVMFGSVLAGGILDFRKGARMLGCFPLRVLNCWGLPHLMCIKSTIKVFEIHTNIYVQQLHSS